MIRSDDVKVLRKTNAVTLLTPKLTPIIECAFPDMDEKVPFTEESESKYPSAAQALAEREAVIARLPLPHNLPRMEPIPLHIPTRNTFAEVFGHSFGNRVRRSSHSPLATVDDCAR